MKIAVIGGGIAGTAAAWAARRAGADVTVVFDRPGASALYAGALDVTSWEHDPLDAPLDSDLLAFCTALEAWSVGARSARVATYEGVLRPARARDSSLLDFAPLAGKRVAVVATRVDGWDGASLSRSLGASAWAVRTRTRFGPVAVEGVVDGAEGQATAYDLALLHDEPGRMKRLAECVRRASDGGAADAWLFGPWLGASPGGADALTALVGKPCGETTSRSGGPAGARFDASRDALLASSGAHVRCENVEAIEQRGARWILTGTRLTASDAGFDAVILAIGGVAGGGIVLGEDSSGFTHAAFHPSVQSAVEVGFAGQPLHRASAEHGVDFSALGIGVLERVGILPDGSRALGHRSLYLAGDCVADRPRSALAAARSGIAAAQLAASASVAAGAVHPLSAS